MFDTCLTLKNLLSCSIVLRGNLYLNLGEQVAHTAKSRPDHYHVLRSDMRCVPFQATLGRVTIQIDKVVTEGVYSGLFSLNHESNKDGSSRTLEIEIIWSNGTPGDDI